MFTIQKNKKNELILDITFNPFPSFLKLLTKLDHFFSSKLFYTVPTGLGLGFGIGIIVFSQPIPIGANSSSSQTQLISPIPQTITFEDKNYSSTVKAQKNVSLIPLQWKNEAIYFTFFPHQADTQVVIGVKNKQIADFQLGEKITVDGINNGIYHYSIYEIMSVKTTDIRSRLKDTSAKIILLYPTNRLASEYLVALAK